MNKKNNLALFTLLTFGIISLFTSTVFAQNSDLSNTEEPTKPCLGEKFVMPQTISADNNSYSNYLEIALLSKDERQKAFGRLSNEKKASFVKIQFALQLVKRPNLTKEQRDFILEATLKISPDLYDLEDPQKVALANEISQETEIKALGLFQPKDAFEILSGLFANKDEDVALLQKYEDLLGMGMKLRKKLVKELPIAERLNIWKTQLAFHLATSTLNKEQKEFIVEIMPKIQAILESALNQSEDEKAKTLEELESNLFKVFTKAEAYAVFMTIGIQNKVPENSVFLEQVKFGYMSQNFQLSQPVKFNSSNMLAFNQVRENKLLQFSCDCRWYCDLQGYSCTGNVCMPANYCGPFGTWVCTNRCLPGGES